MQVMTTKHSSSKRSVKAVIFDLDGVLVSSAKAHCEAYRRTFGALGVRFTLEDYLRIGQAAPRETVIRRVLGDMPEDRLKSLMETKERHVMDFLREEKIHPVPGAVEFLKVVHRRGLKAAVATSSRTPTLLLTAAGVEGPLDVIVDRTQVARAKPFPDIYCFAADLLGVEPGDCLAIEDSPPGVEAAVAAGMTVLALPTTHSAGELAAANEVLGGFEEIDLERWLG